MISRVNSPAVAGRRYSFGQILAVNALVGLLAAFVFPMTVGSEPSDASPAEMRVAALDAAHMTRAEIAAVLGGQPLPYSVCAQTRRNESRSKYAMRKLSRPADFVSTIH